MTYKFKPGTYRMRDEPPDEYVVRWGVRSVSDEVFTDKEAAQASARNKLNRYENIYVALLTRVEE